MIKSFYILFALLAFSHASFSQTAGGGSLTLEIDIHKQPTCDEPCGGELRAEVDGGNNPYSYQWSNGGNDDEIEDLCPGTYSLTVTDALGATVSATVELVTEDGPTLSLNVTDAGCFTAGFIDASVVNAEPPITFSWSNGATTEDLLNAPPGQYALTVVDFHGCSDTAMATIGSSGQLQLETAVQEPECGQSNGSIEASAFAATPPLTFVWSTGATTAVVNNVSAGTYTVTVTDGSGCSAVESVVVGNANGPSSCFSTLNTPCNCNAPYTVSFTNCSTPPAAVTYQWIFEGGTPSTSNETNPTVTYNSGGSFNVALVTQDATGCTDTLVETAYVNVGGFTANFFVSSDTVNVGQTVFVQGPPAVGFEWTVVPNTATVNGSNQQNPSVVFNQPGTYDLCVVATFDDACEPCNESFRCTQVYVFPATGVNAVNTTHQGIALFPNPSNGTLTFRLSQAGTFEVFDLVGRPVFRNATDALEQTIALPAGIFLYRFVSVNGVSDVGKIFATGR